MVLSDTLVFIWCFKHHIMFEKKSPNVPSPRPTLDLLVYIAHIQKSTFKLVFTICQKELKKCMFFMPGVHFLNIHLGLI